MPYYRRSRFLRRVILPITLLAFLSACHKWVDLKPPFERALAEEQAERVRLTLVDYSVLVVKTPTIEGDTLIALDTRWQDVPSGASIDGVGVTKRVHPRLTVPLDQIRQVEVQKANVVGTVLLAAGSAALFVGFVVEVDDPKGIPSRD